jgi:hypothetical protein
MDVCMTVPVPEQQAKYLTCRPRASLVTKLRTPAGAECRVHSNIITTLECLPNRVFCDFSRNDLLADLA